MEAEGKKPPSATENVVTPQQVIDACAAARPSVSIQDRRMYTKIYKKYLADRGQDEESRVGDDAGDNDDDSFGYDVKKQKDGIGVDERIYDIYACIYIYDTFLFLNTYVFINMILCIVLKIYFIKISFIKCIF